MPTPPFRADHVGSLVRPDAVTAARKAHFDNRRIGPEDLAEIEDAAIRSAVSMQQDRGLLAATDGHFRRSAKRDDFIAALTGFEYETRGDDRFAYPTIRDRLEFPDDHSMLAHFRFVAKTTAVAPKIAIPAPSICHFGIAGADIGPRDYRDPDLLFADIAKTYRKAVKAFHDAGCRYLQMDDLALAALCDGAQRAAKKAEGQDPDWLIERYVWMFEEAIADRPADMLVALHIPGPRLPSPEAARAHDAVVDAIFNGTGADLYFLDFTGDGSEGLETLRLLPKGRKRLMAGFISSTAPQLEKLDDLQRRFDAASKHADIGQLGIAPQRGFASGEEGEMSADQQWRKLDLLVKTAETIWGGVDK